MQQQSYTALPVDSLPLTHSMALVSFSALSLKSSESPSHYIWSAEVIRCGVDHKSCRLSIRWDSDTLANVFPE